MSKPKPPAPPNYAAAATAQGDANINSAIASNFLNQVNQVGPNGSQTFSYNNATGHTLPNGTVIPGVTATTTLSPAQQLLLDQQNGISSQLNQVASQGIGYVANAAGNPVSPSNLPSMTTGLGSSTFNPSAVQTNFNPTAAQTNFNATAAPTTLGIQGNYDFSNVAAMPNASDFAGQRDQITQAYMDRLQPYMDRDRDRLETGLSNQGITQGSEAYGWDRAIQDRGFNDQRIGALLAGDQAQQNLFQNAMGIRQQGVGEAINQGNFANQAQGQMFGQNQQGWQNQMANLQAQYGQNQQGWQNQMTASQASAAQNQQAWQNGNSAQQMQFAQGLASGQFSNAARSQALQESDYFQNAPLNMLNALRTGNQVQMPQFGNVAGGAQIAAPPIYGAAQDQYAAQMGQYNARLQQQNALMQGFATIGSSAGMIAASDRRLKKNIRKLFTRLDGLGMYLYQYIWGQWHIGVMADEVAILRPDALGPSMGGFMTVDYGVLNNG